jgi:hypothetical protein
MKLETLSSSINSSSSRNLSSGLQDLNAQCQRILRCTAKAMSSSPGGLRFKAGTRPWLDGLLSAPRVDVQKFANSALASD